MKIFGVLVLLLSNNFLMGQTDIRELSVGDAMPNLELKANIGDSILDFHVADLKGKVVLLDIWEAHCTTCIYGMPEILALQEQLADKLQVFLVTPNSEDEIKDLWKTLGSTSYKKYVKSGKKLPFIVEDSVLTKMFPSGAGIPMHVWIDKNGIYRGSAYNNSTTKENILSLWENKNVELATYYQPDVQRDQLHNWFDQRIGFKDHLLSYSFFTKFDERVLAAGSSNIRDKDSALNKIVNVVFF